MFWRVENSGKRSYLWKDIILKAVTMAKLDFDHTYAEYTLKRPPSSFVFACQIFPVGWTPSDENSWIRACDILNKV